MDFGGILSKLDNPNLGKILGVAATEFTVAQGRGIDVSTWIMLQVEAAFTEPHFPDLSHVWNDLMGGAGSSGAVFKPALIGGIAGYLLKEVNILPELTKIGKLFETLGFNMAIGVGAASLIAHSTYAHSPGEGNFKGGSSRGASYGY